VAGDHLLLSQLHTGIPLTQDLHVLNHDAEVDDELKQLSLPIWEKGKNGIISLHSLDFIL
jgi:hypothetical protein